MQSLQTLIAAMQKAAPPGSTMTDSLTTTPSKWGTRQEVLPEEIAVSMHSLLRQEKFRKTWTNRNSTGSDTPTQIFTFNADTVSPEETIILKEALTRPSLTSLMPHLLALAATKKVDQTDMSAKAYLKILYDAVNDLCETAIILGLRDLRNNFDTPWFPQLARIREESMDYHRHYEDMAKAYLEAA